ncbi:MAG: DUF2182 domain-containing protein [Caulobacteraceae bacterium]
MLAALVAIAALAWVRLLVLSRTTPMAGMGAMTGPAGSADFAGLAAMWAVMMVAMMLPSAAPMVLLYAAVDRRRRGAGALARTGLFALAYLLVWSTFALAAAGLQEELARIAVLTPRMAAASRTLAGAILIGAGLYELTPLKQACLRQCGGPALFLARNWREGAAGALRMGLAHGIFCLGCCWALMLLLFVGGVMSLAWIAGLAGLVLMQKILPGGRLTARITGLAAVIAGAWLISVDRLA